MNETLDWKVKERLETVARNCSIKKLIWKITQNSQEKNHEATLFIKNSFHKNCRLSLTILKDMICFFVNFVEFCGCFFLSDCPSSQSNGATFHFGKVEYCRFINNIKNRTSHQMCCIVKVVLKNFTKSTGIHLCQSLFWTPALDWKDP